MQIDMSLCLPRDASSVPVVRRILGCAMGVLGVVPDVRTDVEVALTEACGNVIRHAQQGEEYEVHIGIEDDLCAIDVVDTGRGWDASMLESAPDGRTTPDLDAQRGRGLHMIQVLTDNARFDNHPRSGAIVHFEKTLEWDEGAPLVP